MFTSCFGLCWVVSLSFSLPTSGILVSIGPSIKVHQHLSHGTIHLGVSSYWRYSASSHELRKDWPNAVSAKISPMLWEQSIQCEMQAGAEHIQALSFWSFSQSPVHIPTQLGFFQDVMFLNETHSFSSSFSEVVAYHHLDLCSWTQIRTRWLSNVANLVVILSDTEGWRSLVLGNIKIQRLIRP